MVVRNRELYNKIIKSRASVILFTLFMAFGILVGIQIQSVTKLKARETVKGANIESLKKQIDAEKNEYKVLQSENIDLEVQIEAYISQLLTESNMQYDIIKSERDRERFAAGFVKAKGPGVVITLDDAPSGVYRETPEIIHDITVAEVLNSLKSSGAQAISINGERLIPTSEQMCSGPTIKINNNRYAKPYVISAIGDADKMSKAFSESKIYSYMNEVNIYVNIEKKAELILPAYNGKISDLVRGLEVVED